MRRALAKRGGFTLIEVLVAGVILFFVISTTTLVFRGALLSSEKAERSVLLSTAIPFLLSDIRRKVRSDKKGSSEQQGKGNWLEVFYSWNAVQIETAPPPPLFDPELGETQVFQKRFGLWRIELTVSLRGFKETYIYREVSW